MPVLIIDRIPNFHFKTYIALSVAIFSFTLYRGLSTINDPVWKSSLANNHEELNKSLPLISNTSNNQLLVDSKLKALLLFMLDDTLAFWGFINTAYCFLAILAKCIQLIFFGELRAVEVQHLKDRFSTFVFYKLIFIFGIINIQFMDEMLFWVIWFTVIGFLQLVSQLCRDRFEYLSHSPVFMKWHHLYLFLLLGVVSSMSCSLFVTCLGIGIAKDGFSAFTFMFAECVLLILKLCHTFIRYCLYLNDTWKGIVSSNQGDSMWKKRGTLAYYVEFGFEISALFVELAHYLHMLVWVWANMFLSVASFMICMQLKVLMQDIRNKVEKHRKYRRVVEHMEKNYPLATEEDLAENSDKCPICWDSMEHARKLPCTHLFHAECLQSWLEQDTSCPTCRMSLNIHDLNGDETHDGDVTTRGRTNNHFFHFDGSRYISWLPSFSVEVTHGQFIRPSDLQIFQDASLIDTHARQVQQLFPHFPLSIITDDIQSTRSVELTIDNILDGRLILPPQLVVLDEESSTVTEYPNRGLSSSSHVSTSGELNSNNTQNDDENVGVEEEQFEGKFSSNSEVREKILQLRREKLIKEARKKYLEKKLKCIKIKTNVVKNDIPSKLVVPTGSSCDAQEKNGEDKEDISIESDEDYQSDIKKTSH